MTPKKTIRINAVPEPPPQPQIRIKPKAGIPERSPVSAKMSEPSRKRIRTEEGDSGAGLKIGIAVAVIVIIAVVVAVASSSGGRSRRVAPVMAAPVSTAPAKTATPPRYDQLGGKTMEEWCKENDRNNAELQARKQRVGSRERGNPR